MAPSPPPPPPHGLLSTRLRVPEMSLRRLPLETHRPPGGTLLGGERCSAQGTAVTEPSVRPRPQGLWPALPRVFPHQAAAPPHRRPLCDVCNGRCLQPLPAAEQSSPAAGCSILRGAEGPSANAAQTSRFPGTLSVGRALPYFDLI